MGAYWKCPYWRYSAPQAKHWCKSQTLLCKIQIWLSLMGWYCVSLKHLHTILLRASKPSKGVYEIAEKMKLLNKSGSFIEGTISTSPRTGLHQQETLLFTVLFQCKSTSQARLSIRSIYIEYFQYGCTSILIPSNSVGIKPGPGFLSYQVDICIYKTNRSQMKVPGSIENPALQGSMITALSAPPPDLMQKNSSMNTFLTFWGT